MSESMTRGAQMMVLQGSSMRHDIGALAKAAPLPCGELGDIPMMVDPELFQGLLKLGIKTMRADRNSLSIQTTTGLKARVPVMVDPHRNMRLSISSECESVDPAKFKEWMQAAVAVSKAVAKSNSVYTYRSSIFSYNKHVLVAVRLSAPWPLPTVANAKHVGTIWNDISDVELEMASCTSSEILVRTKGQVTTRVEAEEETMPLPPLELLAMVKPHLQKVKLVFEAAQLRAAVDQIVVVAQAARAIKDFSQAGNEFVEFVPSGSALTMRFNANTVHLDVPWNLGAIKVPFRAFTALAAIPHDCATVDVVAAPTESATTPLVLRAGAMSFFLAAASGRAA